ncbi:MAG: pilus motility taxis protein HmpF [Nostocaceae cyanobacterium]|nr:pilus motility taxis protein HmpF [Nostocaceae cyanobacterium]
MLYLAEVQKPRIGGFISGVGKTELKLLASQQNDQSWSPAGDEVVTSDEAGKLNDGALVLIELTSNRQVQRLQEAGRPLVNILQNLSRQVEKLKLKEEEIDQWKQSLTFQAQEFNQREIEIDARLEELQNIEDEFQRLETQKQEFEAQRQEIEELQKELERKNQELEGAWEHLRGEQRRLEESLQAGKVVDEEQSRQLNELLDRLSHSVAPTDTVREQLNLAFEMVENQQAILNPHWQQLEEQKHSVDEQQAQVYRLSTEFSQGQQEWEQAQNALAQQTAELKVNINTLHSKKEYAQFLEVQLQRQQELYEQIQSLGVTPDDVVFSQSVDVEALENMPLQELQKTVQEFQEKLEIDSSFVHDQEQELIYKQKDIDELQTKISQASDGERSGLETELADEKDHYQMLNKTLEGQRRHLLEQKEIFKQHQAVLMRRQGISSEAQQIDLKPIIAQIETYKQQHLEELQKLEEEIKHMGSSIEQGQEIINNLTQEQENKRQELQSLEENLLSHRRTTTEAWGRLNLYQEALQPIQDALDGLRHNLQQIAESLEKVQETGDFHLQTLNEMRENLLTLL